jgi:hypothetical protein
VVVRPFIDREGKKSYQLELNSELQALMHASKFVRRGAKRVESTLSYPANESLAMPALGADEAPDGMSGDLLHTAFLNPSGAVVLIVGNPGRRAQTFNVVVGGQVRHQQVLRAGDAITVVLKNEK